MKTQHTPGPWKATVTRYPDGLYNGRPYVTTADGEHVAQAFMNTDGEANARLIAAAPIGYELAEYVLHLGDTGVTTNEKAYVLAQQFMRQATGQD